MQSQKPLVETNGCMQYHVAMKCAFPKVVLASPVFKMCHNFCYCFAPLCWHCFCPKCKVALSLTFVLPRAFICGLNFAIEFVSCAFCPRHVFASIFVTNVAITFAFVGFSFSMLPWRLPLPLPVCHCFCLRGCRGSCHHVWATDRPLILKIWSSNWGGGRINDHSVRPWHMDSCKTGQELVDMLELLRRAFASIGPALNILQGKNDKRVFEGIVFCIGLQNWLAELACRTGS